MGTVACNCQHNQTIQEHSDPLERGSGDRAADGGVLGPCWPQSTATKTFLSFNSELLKPFCLLTQALLWSFPCSSQIKAPAWCLRSPVRGQRDQALLSLSLSLCLLRKCRAGLDPSRQRDGGGDRASPSPLLGH